MTLSIEPTATPSRPNRASRVRQPVRLAPRKFRALQRDDLDHITQLEHLGPEDRLAMRAVASVLPFRTNNYVIEELIDWSNIPDDPIYQLTFPQPGMLDPRDLADMIGLYSQLASPLEIQREARKIQARMNPHPAGQRELNVPRLDGRPLPGIQHKYRETVLFFPSQGQTCHAYCTYCFRWAQFVGLDELRFASQEIDGLVGYLRQHPEVSNVLLTGGDPMMMRTSVLERYLEPLLSPELEHLTTIRIGTKALAYWPMRFSTDKDASELLRLFERVVASGRHLALMAHYSHPRELETPAAQDALRRVRDTGAVIRCQAPLIARINDRAETWAEMWRLQVQLGLVPYYMFVERDTGPKDYFAVPLARAFQIYRDALTQVSGLARTVRGPSMSATPGKVVVDGEAEIHGERVLALRFLQARDPSWVGRPFFAKHSDSAVWLSDLEPAFGESRFFFEEGLDRMMAGEVEPRGDLELVAPPAARRRPVIFGHVEWE